jgi:hypothetical protein
MRDEGILAPQRFAAMLAPGFAAASASAFSAASR